MSFDEERKTNRPIRIGYMTMIQNRPNERAF